ncbi:hypothetical protein, partial [Wolbachia endosymbiont of Pentidionis agamae]|uniref:hypothetical protein n=1 Tax=Wolbachia endosymbiont of Pentidionis agamae TaxID=3110435 RepID=UPI002FD4D477
HTIMIDVHNLLFDFNRHYPDIDVDVNLLSSFPNRDGSYTDDCKNNIMLKGNKKYEPLLKGIGEFIDEIWELKRKGGLNRIRGWWYFGLHSLWYKFYDFVFNKYMPNSIGECSIIDKRIRECLCKIQHSIATGNEGMMLEYMEDVAERMKYEENSDVYELYKIVRGKRWRDYSRKDELSSTSKDDTLEEFANATNQRIKEFDTIQEQGRRVKAEQGREEERKGRLKVEARAKRLEEKMRSLGIDPDSDLEDVRVEPGVNQGASMGRT